MIEQAYMAVLLFIIRGEADCACEAARMLAHFTFLIVPDLREREAA